MSFTKRLFVCGSYAVLERAAVDLLRSTKSAGDPLAPLWVIVPTNLLRLQLGRRVADQGAGHANLRFLTLLDLARELAETAFLEAGQRPISEVAQIALLRRVVSEHGAGYYAALADRPGLPGALLATFSDLADAEIEPQPFEQLCAHAPDKLRTLARLYRAYRAELSRLHLYDRNDLLRAAAERATGQPPPGEQTVWYGFYDFTPLQRRLFAEVARASSIAAFTPWEDSVRFAYATPTVSWLRSLGFELSPLVRDVTEPTDLARTQQRLFEPAAARTNADRSDGSVLVISAPGETREVREIVRAILELVRDRGLRFDEIGVLLRTHDPYGPLVVETLERCGVPVYREGGRPLLETPAGRAFVLLLRVAQEDFARTAVIEFVTTAAIPFATLIDGGTRCAPAQWDVLSAEAGIVAGQTQWTDRLRGLARRYHAEHQRAEDPAPWLAARLAELDRCQRFIARFATDVETIPRRGTWREIIDGLVDTFVRYVQRSDAVGRVTDAVAALAELDTVTGVATFNEVAAAAVQVLASTTESVGAFGRGVFVGDIMPARGLSFRATVIPGLVERGLPRPVREDPLLLDDERRALSERSNRELSEKQRRHDEERLLFTLMLRSASAAAVLSFPRLDMSTARERLPSTFLLHLLTAGSGLQASYRDLTHSPLVRHVALSRLFPQSRDDAIDGTEWNLAAAQAAIAADRPRALSGVFARAPFFQRVARAEIARAASGFTAYDGRLGASSQTRLALREWILSTRLVQMYAQCPFRFFLQTLLGVEELDEPERVQSVTPLDRGTLVHGILQAFYARASQQGIVPLRAGSAAAARALMDEVTSDACEEFEREGLTGLPLLWQRQERDLRELLYAFVAREIERADAYTPTRFEYAFGIGDHVVTLALPGGETVRLRGRIDRVDYRADGRGRVIDYKSGKMVPEASPDQIDPETIQLPFYLHAMRMLEPGCIWESAELHFVNVAAGFKRVRLDGLNAPAAGDAALAAFIEQVVRGIRAGDFRAGAPSCARCEFPSVCGAARAHYALKRTPGEGA